MIANTIPNTTPPSFVTTKIDLVRVLLVVEGPHDIEFLRRISLMLHAHDSSLPHLANMEKRGEVIFVPFGGGRTAEWSHRLAPLSKPEWHLYDRELPPETNLRRETVDQVVSGQILWRI